MSERIGFFDEGFFETVKSELDNFFDFIDNEISQLFGDADFDAAIIETSDYWFLDEIHQKSENIHTDVLKDIEKNKSYLTERVLGINYIDFIEEINNFNKSYTEISELAKLYSNKMDKISDYHKKWLDHIGNIKEIRRLESRLRKEIQDVSAAKLAIEANETDKIFVGLSEKYEDEYDLNNKYFTYSLISTVCCTFLSIVYTFNTSVNEINWPVFISIKLLIVVVGVTLCTLFLRRSVHAKKLHEKAYQIHVEINAYPIFIKSLKEEDQQEITKELALRYFGNDIDQTQNDKIGGLMQEQLSLSTELIRASAEMVKVKSESDSNK